MTPEQAKDYRFDPFDVTKVWPHADFPPMTNGKFTLTGAPSRSRLRFHASSAGYVDTEWPEAAAGATDIVIVMTRASKVAGKVLLDEVGASVQIWARAERSGDTKEQQALSGFRERALVQPDGTFNIQTVRPGQCDLVFRSGNLKNPLLVIDGLVLRPGEKSNDPRLESIDLRGKIEAPKPKQN